MVSDDAAVIVGAVVLECAWHGSLAGWEGNTAIAVTVVTRCHVEVAVWLDFSGIGARDGL